MTTTLHMEGARHYAHPLADAGLILPAAVIRLAPWPDQTSGIWGIPATDNPAQRAEDIIGLLGHRPQSRRMIHFVWGLMRATHRRMKPEHGPVPSIAGVLRGLKTGVFPCSADISMIGPVAQLMLSAGVDIGIGYFNAEIRPERDQCNLPPELSTPEQWEFHDDYADIAAAYNKDDRELDRASLQALYTTARTVLNAVGLDPNAAVVTACAAVVTGWAHNDEAHPPITCYRTHLNASYPGEQSTNRLEKNLSELSAAARRRAVVHFNAVQNPQDFADRYRICNDAGVSDSVLFCDNMIPAEELAPQIDALRPALEAA